MPLIRIDNTAVNDGDVSSLNLLKGDLTIVGVSGVHVSDDGSSVITLSFPPPTGQLIPDQDAVYNIGTSGYRYATIHGVSGVFNVVTPLDSTDLTLLASPGKNLEFQIDELAGGTLGGRIMFSERNGTNFYQLYKDSNDWVWQYNNTGSDAMTIFGGADQYYFKHYNAPGINDIVITDKNTSEMTIYSSIDGSGWLGTESKRWNELKTVHGTIEQLTTSGVVLKGHIIPDASASYDVGTSGYQVRRLNATSGYFSSNLAVGNTTRPPLYRLSVGSDDGSDQVGMYHSNTDAVLTWNDGSLYLQTDEGTDENTNVIIRGKGTGIGNVYIYDEDDAESLRLYSAGGNGYILTAGTTPGSLILSAGAAVTTNIRAHTETEPSFVPSVTGSGHVGTSALKWREVNAVSGIFTNLGCNSPITLHDDLHVINQTTDIGHAGAVLRHLYATSGTLDEAVINGISHSTIPPILYAVQASGGPVDQRRVHDHIIPDIDEAHDIGTDGFAIRRITATSGVFDNIAGASPIAIHDHLVPSSNNGVDLGHSGANFGIIHATSGKISHLTADSCLDIDLPAAQVDAVEASGIGSQTLDTEWVDVQQFCCEHAWGNAAAASGGGGTGHLQILENGVYHMSLGLDFESTKSTQYECAVFKNGAPDFILHKHGSVDTEWQQVSHSHLLIANSGDYFNLKMRVDSGTDKLFDLHHGDFSVFKIRGQ